YLFFFFSSRRRHTRFSRDWSSDVCSSDLFMFATDEFLGVRSSLTYKFMIICSPAGPYYNKPVSIYVQNSYVRAVKGGIGFTKARSEERRVGKECRYRWWT